MKSLAAVALLGLLAAGCGSDSETPTTPTTPTAPTTASWTGTHPLPGSVSRSFAATQAGTVTVTLTSISVTSPTLTLGIGIPEFNSSGCTLTTTVPAIASTTAILTASVDAGTYCLKLYDGTGTATGILTFAATLVHP